MALIKSISGIRGTIGGKQGDNLTPTDIVKFTLAYARWLLDSDGKKLVVLGRDARISGEMVHGLVSSTLISMGIDVIDLGLSTTPTVEVAVTNEKAGGGIILTASHNPIEWNALKLLNAKGEFISSEDGIRLLELAEDTDTEFVGVKELGQRREISNYIERHIDMILDYPFVNREAIAAAEFRIAVDAVNSTGGIAVPLLLEKLGVKKVEKINCEPTGYFAHNPEPLPENLKEISEFLQKADFNLGIVVDPDVDRLAILCEDGKAFGEEYTLVAVADYYLSKKAGPTVSNMSSSRALRDVTEEYGQDYASSAVGEVNVVEKMKEIGAVIGGEGNGGVIVPDFHYGRDALIGIALFLSHLAEKKMKCSELRASYPHYHISKNKIELQAGMDVDAILDNVAGKYEQEEVSRIDGVKIEFESEWVHLRKSNTEPIIRVYSESSSEESAEKIAAEIMAEIRKIAKLN